MKTITHFIDTHRQFLVILFGILVVFSFFRFANLHLRIPFAWDHEQFSTQVRDVIVDHKFTLLGPRVTDDRGFFLAPYFTYLLVPFYMLTGLHPKALMYFIITVNVVFFTLAGAVIYRLIGKKQALLFLFLWAINPLLIKYDTNPWWPVLLPIGVMIVWAELYLIYNNSKIVYWALLGITIGFFCNMHFQFVFVGGFSVIFLFMIYKQNVFRKWLHILVAGFSFAFMFVPLALFDMRHQNLNLHLFLTYFDERVFDNLPYLDSWQPVFANVILPFTRISNPMMSLFFLMLMFVLLIYLINKNRNFKQQFYIATLGLFILTIIGFSLYGRRPSEYYFVYLYPFIYIVLLDFILSYKKYNLIPYFVIFIITINLFELPKTIEADKGGLYYKDQIVKSILPYTTNREVNVSMDMPLGFNNGYMYLVHYYGVKINNMPGVPLIQFRIPPKKDDMIVQSVGVYIPEELK